MKFLRKGSKHVIKFATILIPHLGMEHGKVFNIRTDEARRESVEETEGCMDVEWV